IFRPKYQTKKFLERETGIEPATNSLEGCDSTTELLPPTKTDKRGSIGSGLEQSARPKPPINVLRTWWTGEGSNPRSSQGAADLQSAAFSHSATCPIPSCRREGKVSPRFLSRLFFFLVQGGLDCDSLNALARAAQPSNATAR